MGPSRVLVRPLGVKVVKVMVVVLMALTILTFLMCLGVFLAMNRKVLGVMVRPGIEPGSSGFQPDA